MQTKLYYETFSQCARKPYIDKNLKISERQIQSLILQWLHKKGALVWTQDVNSAYDKKRGRHIKNLDPFFRTGISDIAGIWNKKPIYIEVKRPRTKLQREGIAKDSQLRFISDVRAAGALACFAWSLEDVVDQLFT